MMEDKRGPVRINGEAPAETDSFPIHSNMKPIIIFLFASYLTLIEANYIRFNNTRTENVVLIIKADGFPANNGTLILAGNYTEIMTLNEWEGSFYVYPEECLYTVCDYPVTKIRVAFERVLFSNFYDFLSVDLNEGFNVAASIKSITNPLCDVVSCDANLLEICAPEDQFKNSAGQIVSCKTSTSNYISFKEMCPEAAVDAQDLAIGVCFSMDYEVTIG